MRNTQCTRRQRFSALGVGVNPLAAMSLPAPAMAQALPAEWRVSDIGAPALRGSATYQNGVFTVAGSGRGIEGRSDQLAFAYRQWSGDGTVVARINGAQGSGPAVGVMIRESLAVGSRQTFLGVGAGRIAFLYRASTNGRTAAAGEWAGAVPVWVRLQRQGTSVAASISTDGNAWTPLGSLNVTLGQAVYAGLAVMSRDNRTLATAAFSSVGSGSAGANTAPSVSMTAPAGGSTYTAPASTTLQANATDADGSIADVRFYAGATLLGTDMTAPYSFSWTGVPAGAYSLTAVARDNGGLTTTSTPVSVTVSAPTNQPPTVSLSVPTGAGYVAPASITLTASASDPEGSAVEVTFYAGTTLLGTDAAAPYSFSWSGVAAGSYELTARARDAAGLTTTSAPVGVTVSAPANQPPAISLSVPNGTAYTTPPSIALAATASDADGGIADVRFYAGAMLLGTDATAPYGLTWSGAAPGSYVLTAVARDTTGLTTTSSPVTVTVSGVNHPPVISLTVPNGTSYPAPASIALAANASDPEGSALEVRFYAGTTLLGTDASAPYSFTWNGVAAGSYTLTAVTRDEAGYATTSTPITVTVSGSANQPPAISLTVPSGTGYTAPASITLAVDASDPEGSAVEVTFYAGTTLLGTDTAAPYSLSWSGVTAGSYALTARARDAAGLTTTSATVGVTVSASANQPPTVSLNVPNGNAYDLGTAIALTATAADSDGTLVSVEFYVGNVRISTDSTSPYAVTWSNSTVGQHSLTAVARDNSGGVAVSSAQTVQITDPAMPAFAAFVPSADHDTVVERYVVDFYPANADPATANPVASEDVGRPEVVNGECLAAVGQTIAGLPPGTYFATVSAISGVEASRSDPSPLFTR